MGREPLAGTGDCQLPGKATMQTQQQKKTDLISFRCVMRKNDIQLTVAQKGRKRGCGPSPG